MRDEGTVVLHLGAHKTGTSLLQKYMLHRPRELARLGMVQVPRSRCNDLIGWGGIPRKNPELLREALTQPFQDTSLWSRAAQVRPQRHPSWPLVPPAVRTVILSHENSLGRPFRRNEPGLYPDARACAKGLHAAAGDLNVRIVYYIRSQESFVESYYLQTVHEGGTRTFDEWLAGMDISTISWAPAIEALVEYFGENRVVVRDFTEIQKGQHQFIANFLRTCDPSAHPAVHFPSRRNTSISQQGLDLALVMNPLLAKDQRRTVRNFLQANFNNTSGSRPVLLSPANKEALHDRYSAENASLVEVLGPGAKARSRISARTPRAWGRRLQGSPE